ncbi:hypothetical protein N3K66_004256 [Trichothecium roseum]|uniref:Uncharacterized protein n=1 Tax=Trichothecium roseum TaxID=47278 RepID=A0ACC0V0R2_9HYPO|nr:hypothetical protein N3K66_004256 [Trichothecium roseum]
MAGKLKRSASFIDDNDDSDEQPASRTTKKTKGSTGSELKDDEGNPYWELSNKRRIGLSEFKKMSFINIREYYEKDGKTLPGKKGISLSVEQYTALLKVVPAINAALKEKGFVIEDLDDAVEEEPVVAKSKKNTAKPKKSNIDATSDEDSEN